MRLQGHEKQWGCAMLRKNGAVLCESHHDRLKQFELARLKKNKERRRKRTRRRRRRKKRRRRATKVIWAVWRLWLGTFMMLFHTNRSLVDHER